ncbi:MAG TPA: hypothetical protein ENJ19_04175 [Gammaproteobacteria bacterium]|nr:hypothetical protein [Gammaproteobacteria bacterium]
MNDTSTLQLPAAPRLAAHTKDVVGFDLGHGDTSVTRAPAAGGRVDTLEIRKGLKVIPTAVGSGRGGQTVIGDETFQRGVSTVYQQFKSPYLDDPAVAGPLAAFLTEAVKRLRDNHSTIAFDDTTLLVFGCPSAWSARQRKSYSDFLGRQVGRAQHMLVAESRAALITVKEEGHLKEDELREPILIIDMGSSTTDFTFVRDLAPVELAIGADRPLGAATIERELLRQTLARAPDRSAIEAWWQQAPAELQRTLWEFRKAKEDYFRDEAAYAQGETLPLALTYRPGESARLRLEAELTAADFQAAIDTPVADLGPRPLAWRARFQADVGTAKATIQGLNGGPPRIIILTGGASRMGFVRHIVEQHFAAPTAVRTAPAPEHAIAIGLALAGSIRYRTQSFLDEVARLIDSGQISHTIESTLADFAQAFAHAVTESATERFILPEFLAWRRAPEGRLRDVAARVSARMQHWQDSAEGRHHMLRALTPWYKQLEDRLHELTSPLCLHYRLAADVLDLPKDAISPTHAEAATDPDALLFGDVRLIMSAVLATVSFVTGSVLFGTGTAILLPTGHLAPVLAGLFMWLLSEAAKEWVIDQMMDMTLPRLLRRLYPEAWLVRSVRGRAAETEEHIRSEIIRSLMGGYPGSDKERADKEQLAAKARKEIIAKLNNAVVSALRERAEAASVLIR